jgi:phage shock protein PspC (stress-responsive transcriptional regulator)
MKRKLKRVPGRGWAGGVCAGIAYWLGIPVWLVRLIWVWAIIFYGTGLILYILLWIFMPEWEKTPDDFDQITGD